MHTFPSCVFFCNLKHSNLLANVTNRRFSGRRCSVAKGKKGGDFHSNIFAFTLKNPLPNEEVLLTKLDI